MQKRNSVFRVAVAAACLVGSAGVAKADLTINGAVGLPLNPTAQIPERGSVRVQANFSDLGSGRGVLGGGDLNIGGIYAAGRAGNRLEISGGLERVNGDQFLNPLDETNVAVGVKYLITRQNEAPGQALGGTRVAVGAGYSRALLRNTHAYVVASRDFGGLSASDRPNAVGHLGLRYDDFDIRSRLPFVSNRGSNKASVYGGVEVPMDAQGRFTAVGELQSKNSNFGTANYPYSASVRFRPANQGFSASVGVQREGITGDSGLFAQIGKTF
jgi:hypothetical protein